MVWLQNLRRLMKLQLKTPRLSFWNHLLWLILTNTSIILCRNVTIPQLQEQEKQLLLSSFLNFSTKGVLISKNPLKDLELPRVKNKLPKFLSLNDSLELLKSIDGPFAVRDYCIITLFLNCGMRLSELVGLNLNDYSKDNRTLRLFGKGRKERIVYLNDACINSLSEYLKIRPQVMSEP